MITFLSTLTHVGSSAINSHSLSQLRQARDDTAPHVPTVHSQDDNKANQQVSYERQLQSIAKSTSDSMKVSSTDTKAKPLSDPSHQQQHTNLKDESVQTTSLEGTSTVSSAGLSSSSSEEPHQVMLRCNDKLITALSLDPEGIAGVLLAKGLIPENTDAQVRQCSTPREKATILVTTVRQRIEIAPKRFEEFLDILSKQEWTKDILEIFKSCSGKADVHIQMQSTSTENHSTTESKPAKAISGSEYSSSSEEYTFPTLNPDDVAELEAQLITNAESMKKKFAVLLWNTTESFKDQGISPRRLVNGVLALTEYENPSIGKPLLEREKERLAEAQNIDAIFDILRPHMTCFNYEILEFLIETRGSKEDKQALREYLHEFRCFCRRSAFEIPNNVLGHSSEKVVGQQFFHVKITEVFKSALFLSESTPKSESSSETFYAPELGISLNNAKYIQRKLATVLKLKISSIYLDSVSSGSTKLTFLLPSHISLAGLDSDPDIIVLSSNGIHILCGPPGKLQPKELTSNGLVVQWSQPEYGLPSLAKYILYYQKKCIEMNEWQKFQLSSLDAHTCVPDLSDGDTYVFKICTVSDVGTLQYSDESDPIVISADGILTNNIHKVIVANKDTLTSAFSSADPNTIAVMLSIKGVISKEDEAQISLASTPSEKAILLITTIENQVKSAPEKFQDFLNALSEAKLSLPGDVMETLWSDYYDSVYKQYLDYLKFLYANLDKKQTSSDQWPPSATKKFFRLALIKTTEVKRGNIEDRYVRMTITGKVDDILRQKYPIQLKDIFKETEHQRQVTHKENGGQRKVILLEGAPGCGKSTLSVYICQQWEKGQLFNQFQLVILIRLRDPTVKNAKGLADLLPCPDTTTAQQIAARMLANKCQDVLFILDGWDELLPNLRKNSLFHQIVQPTLSRSNPLCQSTVIVTSRPIASGDLHQVASSRVEILGFTVEQLHQFFTECLKGDTGAVETLLDRIEENPEVAGSCYLPLNATILVHLFKSDRNTLPTTLYGIFSSLVLNCIKRHLKLRTQYKDVSIESLDQLPEFTKKPFSILCQLAYDGVMEDKIIFTSLPADVITLSLLQGVESFIGREKTVSHNFIHLSIQELLAAYYIATQLPASEQVSKFNELFDKSRFSAVFQFYAAITKLRTPGIKDVVVNAVKTYNSKIQDYYTEKEDRVLMVSLLQCLYEAQDPSLCESVAQQLQHGLNLRDTTLTLSDCLCIGYFLAHVCKMAAGEFTVNLSSCSIGDQGCKYLVSGLHKYLDTHSAVTTLLSMNMDSNAISHHGVHHLSTLLNIGCINALDLSYNGLVSKQDAIRGTLAKQLKNNTTLKQLRLYECGLNSQSAESLAEALTTNKHLEQLSVGDNALCDDGIQHLAHALRVNHGLKVLYLYSCGMTDVGLECLAKSLQHNNVLTQLDISNTVVNIKYPNRLTEKIVPFLTECVQNNHTLIELVLPKNLRSPTASIEKAVNDVRKRSGLPLIKVSGMFVPLNENSI